MHNLQYSVEGSTFGGLAYFKHQTGSIEHEQHAKHIKEVIELFL